MIALLPNFGAEEGDEGAVAHRRDLQVAALLWRELFPADARLIGTPVDAPRLFDGGPVFPFLPAEGGVPWLSTARAARRIARLGLRLAGPDPAAVRRVHDKGFAQRVALARGLSPLGAAVRIVDPEELEALPAILAALPPGAWAIKPRLGSSGRGRIAIRGGTVPPLGAAAARLARLGGAVIEPWLERTVDLSVQLHVGDAGVRVLGSTRQILTPSGVYVGNECAIDEAGRARAGTRWDDALEAAAVALGEAARDEGFRGVCGVDAFVYRGADGAEVLRPIVELNARYTMGTVALGILRRLVERGEVAGAGTYRFALRQAAGAGKGCREIPLHGGARAWIGAAAPAET